MKHSPIPRVIARLDIKGPNLVKGVCFEGLRVLGKPEQFASLYYGEGADELVYMDAVASLYGRNSLLDVVTRTSEKAFIPLTVGGGLRSLDDVRTALRAGADKVSLNTAAIRRPELIGEIARTFGSSTLIISIEAYKHSHGYEAYVDYGREGTGVDAVTWALRAAELGAGELMVTSINQEGTGRGLDLELVSSIASRVDIPVIAGGGAGTARHISQTLAAEVGAAAISLASVLHYEAMGRLSCLEADYKTEGNVEFLRRQARPPAGIQPLALGQIKSHLVSAGIPCRPATSDRG